MRVHALVAAVMLAGGCAAGAPAAPPPAPADASAALPAGPGRDLTLRVCSDCHSPAVVARQRLDLAGWQGIVDQMAGQGASATDAELDEIVRYLAAAFPASLE